MTEWDDVAGGWDDDTAVRRYADAAFRSLTEHLTERHAALDGAVICDFGCGTGLLTERLAEQARHVDAVDVSPAMLEVLRAKVDRAGWTHVRLRSGLPIEPQGYDLVVCSSVLAFVDDHRAMVATLARHLSPGGFLIHWDWEYDADDDEPYGLRRDDVSAALEAAELTDIEVATAFEVDVEGMTMRPVVGIGRRPA